MNTHHNNDEQGLQGASDMASKLDARSRNQENFGLRLKQLRENKSMTQQALATKAGTSLTTIQNYERGQFPKGEHLIKLAEALGCTTDWLLMGHGGMESSGGAGVSMQTCDAELVMVPKVEARLSAGTGSLLTSREIDGYYAFRSEWLRRKGNPKAMVLVRVTGDSMSPEIEDEDNVLIDESQRDILPGKRYAVGIDDEVYIKYIDREPGKYILRSVNQRYKPIEVDMLDESRNVRLIGRMLWLARESK